MVFKITVINVVKDLVEKVDNIHGQMKNFSREMEKESNEMLEIKKKQFWAMRNFFNRLISRLDTDEAGIKELEGKSIDMIQSDTTEKKE